MIRAPVFPLFVSLVWTLAQQLEMVLLFFVVSVYPLLVFRLVFFFFFLFSFVVSSLCWFISWTKITGLIVPASSSLAP